MNHTTQFDEGTGDNSRLRSQAVVSAYFYSFDSWRAGYAEKVVPVVVQNLNAIVDNESYCLRK